MATQVLSYLTLDYKMRDTIHQLLIEKIAEAIALLIAQQNLDTNEPLEYFADEIFQLTLEKCAHHLLKKVSLRNTERYVLETLQKDLLLLLFHYYLV